MMLSGSPSPATADCRPWRWGLVDPRGPFTTGMIASRAERVGSSLPATGASPSAGANVAFSSAAIWVTEASVLR